MLAFLVQFVPAICILNLLLFGSVHARMITKNDLRARQVEAVKRWSMQPGLQKRATGVQNITFSNPRASGINRPLD